MGLVNRLVVTAIVAGVVCASAVVFIFGLGLQIHGARYALIPLVAGLLVLGVLRFLIQKAE